MLPLGAGELHQMRDVAAVTFAGTAVIQTGTRVSDGAGGGTVTWAGSGTVACHLSPEMLRGDEAATAGRIAEASPWILTVAGTVTIAETNRVVVESVTYEVVEVMAPRTWQLTKRVRLMEVD